LYGNLQIKAKKNNLISYFLNAFGKKKDWSCGGRVVKATD
jgi:hypothetical protein